MPIASTPNYTPQADGVYVFVQPPQPTSFADISTSLSGIVGTGSWGDVDVPYPASGTADLYDAVGTATQDPYNIATEAICYFDKGRDLLVVRRTDGTDTAAVFTLTDGASTPVALATLIGKYSGSRVNSGTVTIEDAATSTSTKPVKRVTIRVPYANPEVFDGLLAYSISGGVVTTSAAVLGAGIVDAINNGTTARAASNYFLAVAGSSSATAVVNSTFTVSTAGTDGAQGVDPTDLIGSDASPRTGVYALRGSGVAQVALAGVYDPSIGAALQAFADTEYCVALALVGGSGTDTPTGIAAKQNNNLTSVNLGCLIDWVNVKDSVTGNQRLVSPLGYALGITASLPPEQSLGNKPVRGLSSILSTERSIRLPISSTEQGQRAGAGLLYITNQMPRGGGLFGFAHGRNAAGTSGSDTISYARLTNYLVKSIFALLGTYVDELQGSLPNDPLRNAMAGTVRSFLDTLVRQGRIDSQSVTCDLSNNSLATIGAGFAYMSILVRYLSEARYIIPTLQGGTTVLAIAPATAA